MPDSPLMLDRPPQKRDDAELEVRELPGNEKFVYDRQQRVTHYLPSATALIWEKCDGKNQPADLERIVRSELKVTQPRSTVRDAITRLDRLKLLR